MLHPSSQMPQDDVPIVDTEALRCYVSYVVRALKREKRLIGTVFLLCFVLCVLCVCVMPRTYKVSVRILTHRSYVMPALVHPKRAVPLQADAPTQGAVEWMVSRENVQGMMRDVDFEALWRRHRSFVGKGMDFFRVHVLRMSPKDMHEAFVQMVLDKVQAFVEGDVLVTEVKWSNPVMALEISNGLVNRFLQIRKTMETSEIGDTVAILQRSVEASKNTMQGSIDRLAGIFQTKEIELEKKLGPSARKALGKRTVTLQKSSEVIPKQMESEEVRKARNGLADVQRRIAVLKGQGTSEADKAENYWVDLRAQLGAHHPDVEEARRRFEQLKRSGQDMSEIKVLLEEESTLIALLKNKGASVKPVEHASPSTHIEVSEDLYAQMQSDPEIQSILSELKKKQDAHEELVERLEFARIELETADAAFGYRYKITEPPLLPKKPLGPKPWVLVVGCGVFSLLCGCLAAVWKEYHAGRVVQSWQIERTMGLRVLGDF